MSDLRLRLIGALAVLIALSQLHRVEVALAALVVLLVGVAALRPGRDLWHRLLHVEGFVLILVLLLPLTVPGRPVALAPMDALICDGAQAALALPPLPGLWLIGISAA